MSATQKDGLTFTEEGASEGSEEEAPDNQTPHWFGNHSLAFVFIDQFVLSTLCRGLKSDFRMFGLMFYFGGGNY